MDPTEALRQLIAALEAANLPAARESLDALTGWHDRGGFLPRWPESAADPTGLGAFHLGRVIAALDLPNGNPRHLGPGFYTAARREYRRALAAIGGLLPECADDQGDCPTCDGEGIVTPDGTFTCPDCGAGE